MPINSKIETTTEDGIRKDAMVFSFTNGAREQLAELTLHFKKESELELIKLAISLLQKFKEDDDKNKIQSNA